MPVEFAVTARGFGPQAERIESGRDLRPAFARAFASNGPYSLGMQVDPRGYNALLKALRG